MGAHLRQVEAQQFVLRLRAIDAHRHEHFEEHERGAERPGGDSHHADQLRHELAAVSEEKALDRVADDQEVWRRPIGKEPHCEDAEGAAHPVHSDRTHRVVHLQRAFDEHHGDADEPAGHGADEHGEGRADVAGWRGNRHQAGEEAVDHVARVVLFEGGFGVGHRRHRAGRTGEHGDHGHLANTQVAAAAGPECGARVKAKPTEGEDERADRRHVQIVARHRIRRPIFVEFAQSWPKHHGPRKGGPATHHVDNARACKVHVRPIEATLVEREQPPAAPDPVGHHRLDQRADEDAPDHEAHPRPAFGDRAGEDRRRGVHEDHLEEEEDGDADIQRPRRKKEPLVAEDAVINARDGDAPLFVEREEPRSEVRRTRQPHAPEGDSEAHRPVGQHADAVDHEVGHHHMHRAFRPAEAGLHHREPGLHEHHQVAGDQHPDEVNGDAVLVDVARKVVGERLVRLCVSEHLGGGGGIDCAIRARHGEALASADANAPEILRAACGGTAGVHRWAVRERRGCSQCEDHGRNRRQHRRRPNAAQDARRPVRRRCFGGQRKALRQLLHGCVLSWTGGPHPERPVTGFAHQGYALAARPVADELAVGTVEQPPEGHALGGEPVANRQLHQRQGGAGDKQFEARRYVPRHRPKEHQPPDRIDRRTVVLDAFAEAEKHVARGRAFNPGASDRCHPSKRDDQAPDNGCQKKQCFQGQLPPSKRTGWAWRKSRPGEKRRRFG